MRRILVTTILLALVSAHMDTSGCGKSKQCVFVPVGCETTNTCRQVMTYTTGSDGWTDMELFSTNDSPGNNYIAAGFSNDDLMGDDFVTHCMFPDTGMPEAHLTFNFGKSNAPPSEDIDTTAEKEHLELVHAHKDGEGMYCHIRQKSSKAKNQFVPDLDKEHVIFLARSKTRNPRALGIHSLDPASPDFPFISEKALNVGKPAEVQEEMPAVGVVNPSEDEAPTMVTPMNATPAATSGLSKATRFTLVKIHGVLMIVAWFFFIIMAVLAARYLRDHFPDSSPYNLKWWFHLHRTMNLTAVVLIVISLLIIFFAKDWTWTGPVASMNSDYNTNPGAIHSLFGIIAVSISFLQPVMSLLRCAPDTGARPIFNWTHRVFGIIGVVCAMVAAVIAANSMVSAWWDSNWALSVVLFYIVILILALILFEVLNYMKEKAPVKTGDVELHHRSTSRYDDRGQPIHKTRVVQKKPLYGMLALYILFALFALCTATALVVMLFI